MVKKRLPVRQMIVSCNIMVIGRIYLEKRLNTKELVTARDRMNVKLSRK